MPASAAGEHESETVSHTTARLSSAFRCEEQSHLLYQRSLLNRTSIKVRQHDSRFVSIAVRRVGWWHRQNRLAGRARARSHQLDVGEHIMFKLLMLPLMLQPSCPSSLSSPESDYLQLGSSRNGWCHLPQQHGMSNTVHIRHPLHHLVRG